MIDVLIAKETCLYMYFGVKQRFVKIVSEFFDDKVGRKSVKLYVSEEVRLFSNGPFLSRIVRDHAYLMCC